MFLVYSGVFRDATDPLVVSRHYIECLKNREGFLSYGITKPEFFNTDKVGAIYNRYRMNLISKTKFSLKKIREKIAYVEGEMIYKDKKIIYVDMELSREGRTWLVSAASFREKGS